MVLVFLEDATVGRKEKRLRKLKNVLGKLLRKEDNVTGEKECHGE